MGTILKCFKDYPTLSLTILSAYLYLCTYEYESAYLQEFNVSNNYLTLDFNTLLKDGSRILSLGFLILSVEEFLSMLFKGIIKKAPILGTIIKNLIRLAVFYILLRAVTPITGRMIFYTMLCFFSTFVLFFIWIILTTWIEKRKEKPSPTAKISQPLSSESSSMWNNRYFGVLLYIFFPFFMCTFFGSGEASKQESFQMIADSGNYVLIRKYGDELICKDLQKDNSVGSKTVIFKLSTVKPLIVIDKNLGRIGKSRYDLK